MNDGSAGLYDSFEPSQSRADESVGKKESVHEANRFPLPCPGACSCTARRRFSALTTTHPRT
jgi:hypothetical protein